MIAVERQSLLVVVDGLTVLSLGFLDLTQAEVDLRATFNVLFSERGEHLLVVRERGGPVLQGKCRVCYAADGIRVGHIQLMSGLISGQSLVKSSQLEHDHTELLLQRMLLGSFTILGTPHQHLSQRSGIGPLSLLAI